jgi:hypothetical protein
LRSERPTERSWPPRAVSIVMELALFFPVPHFLRQTGSTSPENALAHTASDVPRRFASSRLWCREWRWRHRARAQHQTISARQTRIVPTRWVSDAVSKSVARCLEAFPRCDLDSLRQTVSRRSSPPSNGRDHAGWKPGAGSPGRPALHPGFEGALPRKSRHQMNIDRPGGQCLKLPSMHARYARVEVTMSRRPVQPGRTPPGRPGRGRDGRRVFGLLLALNKNESRRYE